MLYSPPHPFLSRHATFVLGGVFRDEITTAARESISDARSSLIKRINDVDIFRS